MAEFRVMTFNLRIPSERDGINEMQNRTGRILEVLREEAPDLIGFQEASGWVWDWLEGALAPDYCFLGCGRDADRGGEGTPVAFRRDRFRLYGLEHFWLSDTPELPGSRYADSDQSGCPRMATSVLLRERESGAFLTMVNAHTDHRGELARRLAMRQLADYLCAKPHNRILTGDLNAFPESVEVQSFLADTADQGIRDVSAASGSTFHGFSEAPKGKIDYIMTDLPPRSCRAVKDHPVGGVYYSDHFAVVADLALE